MSQVQWKMESAVGPIYLVASEKGLQGILWKPHKAPMIKALNGDGPEIKILLQTKKELTEYFEGKRQEFDLPVDIGGTDFQKRVWQQLSKIPYGKTCSYKDVATKINTAGVRAVGTANGRNPLSIIVPCHRVIASDGTLGGYAGGLEVKEKLLRLEQQSKSKK